MMGSSGRTRRLHAKRLPAGLFGLFVFVVGVVVGPLVHLIHHRADHVHTLAGEVHLGFDEHEHSDEAEDEDQGHHDGLDDDDCDHDHHALDPADHRDEADPDHDCDHDDSDHDDHGLADHDDHELAHHAHEGSGHAAEHEHHHPHRGPAHHGDGSLQHFGVALLGATVLVVPTSALLLVEPHTEQSPIAPAKAERFNPAQPRAPPS